MRARGRAGGALSYSRACACAGRVKYALHFRCFHRPTEAEPVLITAVNTALHIGQIDYPQVNNLHTDHLLIDPNLPICRYAVQDL